MDVCFPTRELAHGIPVLTEDGEVLGTSQEAAKRGIAQVVFSRIIMAVPGMCGYIFLLDVVHMLLAYYLLSFCLSRIPWKFLILNLNV